MVRSSRTVWLVLLPVLGACSSMPPHEVDVLLRRAEELAVLRHARGDERTAEQLLRAVATVAPGRARPFEQVFDDGESVTDRPWLGVNRAERLPVDRAAWARVLLYLPDRLLDLLDVISFDVHLGPGVFVDVHVTRAVQLAAGGRFVAGLGWHERRSLGGRFLGQAVFDIPVIGSSAHFGGQAGTSGLELIADGEAGLHRPSSPLHLFWRDYWAVGLAATVGLAGIDLDLHPLEIADFGAGLVTVDFLRDDFAATTGLDLSGAEEKVLRDLMEVRFSDAAEDYRRAAATAPAAASVP